MVDKMTEETKDHRRRRTGGRSARVRRTVLDAAIKVLVEGGPERFGIPEVAERAGVHKTSIYRRWGDAGSLLLDALLSRAGEELPVPDTGSLEEDLLRLVEEVAAFLEGALGGALVRMAVSMVSNEDLVAARREYFSGRFARVAEVFERAVEREELPAETDPHLALETLVGPLYLRVLVTGEPLDEAFQKAVVEILLGGLRATKGSSAD